MIRDRALHWWKSAGVGHHLGVADIAPSELIDGVYIVTPQIFGDERGQFVETYRKEWIPGAVEMIQANRADRSEGCLVGLHYHRFQADYWYVPFGRALVLLHDLREGARPTVLPRCWRSRVLTIDACISRPVSLTGFTPSAT